MRFVQYHKVSNFSKDFKMLLVLTSNFSRCHARIKVDKDSETASMTKHHNHEPVQEPVNTSIDVSDEIQFQKTSRGGFYLFLEGIKFVKGGENNGITHYRCYQYMRKCRARVAVKSEKATFTGSHNH